MESSGEYLPAKKLKPADRQGQQTAKQIILDRLRIKLAHPENPTTSSNQVDHPDQHALTLKPSQAIQEIKG